MKSAFIDIMKIIAVLSTLIGSTSYFLLSPLNMVGCVAPTDDLVLMADTTICSGTYNIPDAGVAGVIKIGASGITVDCDHTVLVGTGVGSAFNVDTVANVVIKGCKADSYNKAFLINAATNFEATNNTLCNNVQPFDATASTTNIHLNHFCINLLAPDNNGRYMAGVNPYFEFRVTDLFTSPTQCYVVVDDIDKGNGPAVSEDYTVSIKSGLVTERVYQNYNWKIRCYDGNNTAESDTRKILIVADYQYPTPILTPTPEATEEATVTPNATETATPTPEPTITPTPIPTPTPTPYSPPTPLISVTPTPLATVLPNIETQIITGIINTIKQLLSPIFRF